VTGRLLRLNNVPNSSIAPPLYWIVRNVAGAIQDSSFLMNEGRLPSRKVPFAYLWSNSTRAASGCEAVQSLAGRCDRRMASATRGRDCRFEGNGLQLAVARFHLREA